jgi:hypothetical protein
MEVGRLAFYADAVDQIEKNKVQVLIGWVGITPQGFLFLNSPIRSLQQGYFLDIVV